MALTLRTAITADQTVFDVLGDDDLQPGDFKTLDSETIVIRTATAATLAYGESPRWAVSVYRGSGGTRAAAHAVAATLATYSAGGGSLTLDNTVDPPTSITTIVVPGASVAGDTADLSGVLQLRLIGPFHVAYNTAGINGRHHVGPDLVTGTVVLRAWAQVVDGDTDGGLWDGAVGNIHGQIGIEDAADSDSITLFIANNGPYATMPTEYRHGDSIPDAPSVYVGVVRSGPGHIYVWMSDDNNDAPTQGQADIYAIIATPAA